MLSNPLQYKLQKFLRKRKHNSFLARDVHGDYSVFYFCLASQRYGESILAAALA